MALDAEKYVNDQSLELGWAIKSYEHAETYFNLLTSLDPTLLKLTSIDDTIYTRFTDTFVNFDVASLNENTLKSRQEKEIWRPFCMEFEGLVDDYNFGTLLRLDCTQDYSESNTIIVPRIQFLAIEIARNRKGHNSDLRKRFCMSRSESTSSKDKV